MTRVNRRLCRSLASTQETNKWRYEVNMIELVPEFSTLCIISRMFTVFQKKMLNVTSTADLKNK